MHSPDALSNLFSDRLVDVRGVANYVDANPCQQLRDPSSERFPGFINVGPFQLLLDFLQIHHQLILIDEPVTVQRVNR